MKRHFHKLEDNEMHDFGTLRPKSWDIKGANFLLLITNRRTSERRRCLHLLPNEKEEKP